MVRTRKRRGQKLSPLQIFFGTVGVVGSTLSILQVAGVLSVETGSALEVIKTPPDPIVSIMAIVLFIVSFMLLNSKKRK